MRKGKHRRHRDARNLKRMEGEAASRALGLDDDREEMAREEPCIECGRVLHAEWCRAED